MGIHLLLSSIDKIMISERSGEMCLGKDNQVTYFTQSTNGQFCCNHSAQLA